MALDIRKLALAFTACAAIGAPLAAHAQSTYDEQQQLISQIQTDKRTVVLKSMALDDTQLAAFTPIYDKYQAERKKLADRGVDILNLYASNYESMTTSFSSEQPSSSQALSSSLRSSLSDSPFTSRFALLFPRARLCPLYKVL